MKKLLLSSCLLAVCAASVHAQLSLGPEAGMIFSNYPEQVNGGALPVKAKFGMRIGVVADLGISRHFYIDPALLYVMNGDNVNYVFENDIVRVNTLQLPVNVVFKSGHPGGERFVIGAGPYFARNMSGTRKVATGRRPASA